MRRKQIKAVEVVRRIRDEHHELLKGKSTGERIEFYRRKAQAVGKQATGATQEREVAGKRG